MGHSPQQHPYHLVDPSPLPILSAFSTLALVAGALMYMHEVPHGGLALAGGVLLVLACMYGWWRNVIREGLPHHSPAVQNGLRIGMGLFITSEVMFFAAFFWAFFNAAGYPLLPLQEVWGMGEGIWPPKSIHAFDPWHIPFMNTLILLLSGTTVTWAHHALLEGKRDELKQALWLTVLLGLTFSGLQAYEYHHAAFGFTDGIYASTFYMATGFHGAHVIIGTIFLAVCLARTYKNQLDEKHHLGFEFAAWYWHFVDVVWLFLFVFVYWWGGGH